MARRELPHLLVTSDPDSRKYTACALEARRWERFVAAEGSASAALREALAAMARGARRRT